jgi:hypothetical protein
MLQDALDLVIYSKGTIAPILQDGVLLLIKCISVFVNGVGLRIGCETPDFQPRMRDLSNCWTQRARGLQGLALNHAINYLPS